MSSKLPVLKGNCEQWIIDKMKYIAEQHDRSLSKELSRLCKDYIKEYEKENGEIIAPAADMGERRL